jgi:RluA family pseudouridine synthase
MQTFTVSSSENRTSLLDTLVARLNLSRKKAKALIDRKIVFVNNRRVWMARHRLATGDAVEIHQAVAAPVPSNKRPRILHEDEDYLIVDKPAGWLSNGPDSLESHLRAILEQPELVAVHRLDRDTTGCLIFAKNRDAFDRIVPLFKGHAITKLYQAIAIGRIPATIDEIRAPIEGEEAVTRLRVLDANSTATHVKLLIATGRTHQIRRHLQHIHHPVMGDAGYATRAQEDPRFRNIPRQMLHAVRLSFKHPMTGAIIRATAPLPADFKACLGMLKLT